MSEVRNVTTSINKGKLIIEVDISDKTLNAAPMSKTGKSKLVASTGGFTTVADSPVRISLNVIK